MSRASSAGASGPAIVLYDAECGLCTRSAEFIARRDKRRRFQLGTLQSEAGRRVLAEHGAPADVSTLVLVDESGRAWSRSGAALRIARRLRAPWPAAALLLAVPRPLRDWAYDVVARRRRRWFGGAESCPAPSPAVLERRLE